MFANQRRFLAAFEGLFGTTRGEGVRKWGSADPVFSEKEVDRD